MVVVADGLHEDAVSTITGELFGGRDLQTFFDHAGMEVAARDGSEAEEEELEWLTNKDAFPTVEKMAPAPAVERRTRAVRRGRPPRGPTAAAGLHCRHCRTTKTPQWREGPDGRRTLCNACGMRYRSGQLLPEYRPLNSPTFSPELHSNVYRRVIQLRHRTEPSAIPARTAAAERRLHRGTTKTGGHRQRTSRPNSPNFFPKLRSKRKNHIVELHRREESSAAAAGDE